MVLIIEDCRIKKSFLGGYRDRNTSVEYLNAVSQTGPSQNRKKCQDTRSREVQSLELNEAACQPLCHRTTQTLRNDYYTPNCLDVYKTAKSYKTQDEIAERLNFDGNARIIQKYYRAYRLFKYIKDCAERHRNALEDCKNLESEQAENLRFVAERKMSYVNNATEEKYLRRKRHTEEIRRQTFPRSRADFDKLYNLIESWRVSRLEIINNEMFGGSRGAENCQILEQTTQMLKAIDKHRHNLAKDHSVKKRIRFLTEHCKPIRWNGYKAKPVEMITLRIQKAREYKSIYDKLTKKDANPEDRLELLILLKNSLRNHICIIAQDFISLLDQEIVLLSTGIKELWLNNLRERILNTYLHFISQAASCGCLHEGEDLSDNKQFYCGDMTKLSEQRKLLCRSCMKMLPYRSFSAHVRMKKLSCCLSCSWLRQQNIDKSHYGPYTFLLNGIRVEEQRRNCYSSLLYVIREPGIYHLVNNIWHGHSIVSENHDLFNLRLVRFNVNEEWAPWNCILLTGEEAETHYYVKDFTSFYSKRLLHKIYLAHQIAKTQFKELISFEKKFRESSRYYIIQDRKDYEPCNLQFDYSEKSTKLPAFPAATPRVTEYIMKSLELHAKQYSVLYLNVLSVGLLLIWLSGDISEPSNSGLRIATTYNYTTGSE